MAALPPPWVERSDPKTGKAYYVNTETKATSWQRPVADDAALPDGWVEKADPKTGKAYFYHAATKKTQWARPELAAEPEGTHPEPSGSPRAGSAEGPTADVDAPTAEPQARSGLGTVEPSATHVAVAGGNTTPRSEAPDAELPDGWVEKADPAGKAYYYHKASKTTQWKRPARSDDGHSAPAALPDGWVEKADPKTGKPYFYHAATKKTQWAGPEPEPEVPHSVADNAASPAAAASPASHLGVPSPRGGSRSGQPSRRSSAVALPADETPSGAASPGVTPRSPSAAVSATAASTPAAVGSVPLELSVAAPSLGVSAQHSTGPSRRGSALPALVVEAPATEDGHSVHSVGGGASPVLSAARRASTAGSVLDAPSPAAASSRGASEVESAVHEGRWVARQDPRSSREYYYHTDTKQTTWIRPAELGPTEGPSPRASAQPSSRGSEQASPKTSAHESRTASPRPSAQGRPSPPPARELAARERCSAAVGLSADGTLAPLADLLRRHTAGPEPSVVGSEVGSIASRTTRGLGRGLPPPWIEKVDVITGEVFYFNTLTRKASYVRPQAPASEANVSRSGDWERRLEPHSGRWYFFHPRTGETRWEDEAGGGSSKLGLDVKPGMPTLYVVAGQPSTGTVMRYNGGTGSRAWGIVPEMELPVPLGSPCVAPHPTGDRFLVAGCPAVGAQRGAFVQFEALFPPHQSQAQPQLQRSLGGWSDPAGSVLGLSGSGASAGGGAVGSLVAADTPFLVPSGNTMSASASAPGDAVLITGGYTDVSSGAVSDECFLCDVGQRRTHVLPPLQIPRGSHTVAVVDASTPTGVAWYAIAAGGFDGVSKTDTVERYILGRPHWERIATMLQPRSAHATVAVGETVYVFGGRSGYEVTHSCEALHTQTTRWAPIAAMRNARCNFSAAALHSYVFCVGGWNGSEWIGAVEAYDLRLDLWREVQALPTPRGALGLVVGPWCRLRPDEEDVARAAGLVDQPGTPRLAA